MNHHRAMGHYAGAALLLAIGGIIFLTHDTLTYEGNDIAQAGILIGILGTVVTGILGFMSGMALGRHMAAQAAEQKPESEPVEPPELIATAAGLPVPKRR